MDFKDSLRKFILENYLFTEDQSQLEDSTSFLESGIIDSTGILEVITFIQEALGITIEDDEMVPENLDSINNIMAFTSNKTS